MGANLCNTIIELFSLFKKFGTPTSEDLLWIMVRCIDQPMSGHKPLSGVLEPSFLQKTDREILKILEAAILIKLFASFIHLCTDITIYRLVFHIRVWISWWHWGWWGILSRKVDQQPTVLTQPPAQDIKSAGSRCWNICLWKGKTRNSRRRK